MHICIRMYYYYIHIYFSIFVIVGSTVKFSQMSYSTAEDNGALQPMLILSNPLSNIITIEVFDINGTSAGE